MGLLVGLGARGLVYHAWLGALVAQGVLDGSEQHIPAELLAWKTALGRLIMIMLHSYVLEGQHDARAQLQDCDTGERPQNPSYRRCVAHKVATKGESTHQLLCKLHPPPHTTQHTTQPYTPYPRGHWSRAL